MVDSVKLQHKFPSQSKALEWRRLMEDKGFIFNEAHNKKYLTFKIKNIYIKFNIEQRTVYFENSLHKFYHGTNSSIFTFLDLKKSIDKLCKTISISSEFLKITYLEIGINIQLPNSPNELLENLLYFDRGYKFFYPSPPPKGHTKPLLYSATFSEYQIKLYNKSKYEQIAGKHILRFEIKFYKTRKIKSALCLQNKKITLEFLTNKSFYNSSLKYLREVWSKVRFKESVDFSSLSPKDATIIPAMESLQFIVYLKFQKKNIYKEFIKKYKALKKSLPTTRNKAMYNSFFEQSLASYCGVAKDTQFHHMLLR